MGDVSVRVPKQVTCGWPRMAPWLVSLGVFAGCGGQSQSTPGDTGGASSTPGSGGVTSGGNMGTTGTGGNRGGAASGGAPVQGKGGQTTGGGLGDGGSAGLAATGGAAGHGGASRSGNAGASGSGGAGGKGGGSGGAGGKSSASGGAGGPSSGGTSEGSKGGSGGQGGASGSAGASGAAGGSQLSAVNDAYCATARTCCAGKGVPVDLVNCETKVGARQPNASIQSGAVRVDATKLAACQAAYQQAATGCEANPVIAACRGVYIGTKKAGEACSESGYDCDSQQGPATCHITTGTGTTGTCKPVPRGKSGGTCLSTCRVGDNCSSTTFGIATDSQLTLCFEEDGLYCDFFSDTPTCKPIVALGMPCGFSDACGSGAICNSTCQAAGGLGEPCGAGCRHELTCTNDRCQSPTFVGVNSCDGYSLGP